MTVSAIVGPGFPAFAVFGLACSLAAVFLFARGARSAETKLARMNATKGWVGALLPFGASAAFLGLFRVSNSPTFDPIVPVLSFSVVLYASAVFSQQIPAASLSAIREIFASLPDGLAIVNRAGLVTFANAAAGAILGAGKTGVEGNDIATVLKGAPMPVQARARLEFAYAEVNTGQRESSSVTFELTEPGPRTLRAVVGSTTVGRSAGGAHALGALSVTDRYLFIVLHDETDSRTKEAALSRANEIKDLFISMIGHDLKAPLNAISGYGELIALDSQSSPDALAVYRYAQSILGSARQIHLMMENARTFSRLVDPEDILRARELVDLEALVEREATNLRSAADRKLIRVDVGAPASQPRTQVFAAPILRSVFQNLIDNAIKYGPEKSTVHVRFRASEKAVDIEIDDEGPGIPTDKREAIFKRYTRLEQTRSKTEGLGLGLAISRQIVELHGGTLTVHNRPDGAAGALFRVHLPMGVAR
jgi:signal transduction histidine kinase